MKRLMIMTVGKTHSGKSTFAKTLAGKLSNSLVIDQDNHAEFINAHYRSLLPKKGPNTFKYTVSDTIVDYAITQSNYHLILSNAFRSQSGRLSTLNKFKNADFTNIIINFNISDKVLAARVAKTQRSTLGFRSSTSFEEVLARQQAESEKGDVIAPRRDESDYQFDIVSNEESKAVIEAILNLSTP